jgi:malonyl CoA-acyl carrier protein transacylase/NAD(P)-dependent dehydrogenase (short-subunit alcohol dehydrogenase family)
MFPPAAFTREERAAHAEALTDTRVAQPALGIADLAVVDVLASLGARPDMTAGHSYGELAALCVAGTFGIADLLQLSEARGEAILAEAGDDPGTMAAVAAAAETVAPVVAGCDVVIANHNSPKQCVLSGSTAAIEMALVLLAEAKLTARRIPVACAFHSPIVAGARDTLARRLAAMPVATPRIPVWSNVDARPYPSEPDQIRAQLASQVASPVRFAQQIEAMYADGARIFVETGPGQVLTRLVGETLGDRPHVAITCDVGETGGVRQLLKAVGTLAVAGAPIDPGPLFWDRDAQVIDLDVGAPGRAPAWLVNGHGTRPADSERVPAGPIAIVPAPATTVAVAGERGTAVIEYLRNMRSLIAAQRDVMLSYLGTAPSISTAVETVDATRPPARPPANVIDVAPSPAPAAVGDPLQLVVSIVSERTGYPVETLGVDLDLEADLSIDSIKRIEIIGELAHRLGLRVEGQRDSDKVVEELATRKTLRALVDWLTTRLAASAAETPAPTAPPLVAPDEAPSFEEATTTITDARGRKVGRYKLAPVAAPAPPNGRGTFERHSFAICEGGDVGTALAARLAAEGASVRRISRGEPVGAVDGYVDLTIADGIAEMRELFERVREAALAGAKRILVATWHGEGGPAGLIKTLAAEWPSVAARVVDLSRVDDPAAILHGELHAADPHVEIVYVDGVRSTLEVVPADGAASPGRDLALDARSVLLVTGGARGITAQIAIALAKRYGCRIELVGRSPLPPPEDAVLADAGDARALRALLARRSSTPAEIEQQCTRVLADREIRATLAALGERATYHAIDVRTPAFGDLIDELYRRHGRIDGVIHGAGILEDKLMRHKSSASFERVYATKLAGARTLLDRLRPDVGFVVMLSSISGAFGNRGQADYAAAGDALDKLASSMQRAIAGRVVSIDWGPWSGAGMVSAELEREYARRSIALIDPERGVEALIAELRGGDRDTQVILSASDPRALVRPGAADHFDA